MKPQSHRSQLNTFPVIKWLRTRFNNEHRRNPHYLFSPEELIRQREIERIFTEFDSDGSGGLSREEIYNMFQGFDIDMPLEKLDELYDSVEKNLSELDLSKFKQCALSERSNRVFTSIINGMKKEGYMPTKFTEMITYLVYLSKREDLMKKINDREVSGEKKVESMMGLLQLRELAENNKQVNTEREKLKSGLKLKFHRAWNQVTSSMNITELEPTPQLLGRIRQACKKKKQTLNNGNTFQIPSLLPPRRLKTRQ